jgi:hypothetical protein
VDWIFDRPADAVSVVTFAMLDDCGDGGNTDPHEYFSEQKLVVASHK